MNVASVLEQCRREGRRRSSILMMIIIIIDRYCYYCCALPAPARRGSERGSAREGERKKERILFGILLMTLLVNSLPSIAYVDLLMRAFVGIEQIIFDRLLSIEVSRHSMFANRHSIDKYSNEVVTFLITDRQIDHLIEYKQMRWIPASSSSNINKRDLP